MKAEKWFGTYHWSQTPLQKRLLAIFNWFYDFVPEPDKLDWRAKVRRKRRESIRSLIKSYFKVLPYYVPDFPERLQANSVYYDGDLNYSYPYNPSLRKAVVAIFVQWGWRVSYEKLEKGSDTVHFKKPDEGSKICLRFSQWNEGSTCQRIKIGTRMVEEDVYDTICNEAAAEMQEQANAQVH